MPRNRQRHLPILRILTHAGALLPLALIVFDAFTRGLTVNPIQDITFRTGRATLRLLVLTLACTPIYTLFKYPPVLKVRRTLGLYAFFYLSLHLSIFIFDNALTFDYRFNPAYLQEAIFEKRYALVGFSAFLVLLPLAITSTKGWQRRLGKNWKRLHKGVYLAILLGIAHFTWVVKSDVRRPLAWGAVVVILLALRLPVVKAFFRKFPPGSRKRGPAARLLAAKDSVKKLPSSSN